MEFGSTLLRPNENYIDEKNLVSRVWFSVNIPTDPYLALSSNVLTLNEYFSVNFLLNKRKQFYLQLRRLEVV